MFNLSKQTGLNKKFLYKLRNFKVYSVNGGFVRDNLLVDFSSGGNHQAYPKIVPENEIWLEEKLDQKEKKFILIHELTELSLMQKGYKYEDAHDLANLIESIARFLRKEQMTKQAQTQWSITNMSDIDYNEPNDNFYYHITTPENANSILQEGLKIGKKPSMAQGAYRIYSKGKLFLTEKSTAKFWADRIREHLQHESDEEIGELVAIRIPKSDINNALPDELGERDSGGKSYYITQDVPIKSDF